MVVVVVVEVVVVAEMVVVVVVVVMMVVVLMWRLLERGEIIFCINGLYFALYVILFIHSDPHHNNTNGKITQ